MCVRGMTGRFRWRGRYPSYSDGRSCQTPGTLRPASYTGSPLWSADLWGGVGSRSAAGSHAIQHLCSKKRIKTMYQINSNAAKMENPNSENLILIY